MDKVLKSGGNNCNVTAGKRTGNHGFDWGTGMIDRERTIRKAVARYNLIFPVKGKQLLEECFFCLRGEYHLVFKTKDNKVHTMKACEMHTNVAVHQVHREQAESFFKLLNKPIIIRSLFVRKPVRTCLINLFPVPGISWSRNDDNDDSITSSERRQPQIIHHAASRVELTSATGATGAYTALQQRIGSKQPRFEGTPQQPSSGKNFYHLEVIAPGCFPVIIDREMFQPHHAITNMNAEKIVRTAPAVITENRPSAARPYAWPTYDER